MPVFFRTVWLQTTYYSIPYNTDKPFSISLYY